jgi:hypothetical protein
VIGKPICGYFLSLNQFSVSISLKKGTGYFIVAGLECTGSCEAFAFCKAIATLLFSGIEIVIFVTKCLNTSNMLRKLKRRTNLRISTVITLLLTLSSLILSQDYLEIGIYLPS